MAKKKGNKTPKKRLEGVDNVVEELMQSPYVQKVTTGNYQKVNGHIPRGYLMENKSAKNYSGLQFLYVSDRKLGQVINVYPKRGYQDHLMDEVVSMPYYKR
ncbi:MAG: hypothetical protein ACQESF_07180 [Nanobdellota archaeon]